MIRTSNPALSDKIFSEAEQDLRSADSNQVMTLDGTVNKTAISILLVAISAYITYSRPELYVLSMPAAILGFIIAMVTIFKKTWAPYTTPAYAIVEGVLLGAISAYASQAYPGIVFQAVSLTFGTLFALLLAYRSGLIKATENFKLGVVAATGGIALVYIASFILSFFGIQMSFLHNSSMLSIGISCFVIVIAALNLVLDFDFIENAAESGRAPKYMEWYGAFGLLITLVWLYIEILRLLMKLNSRN